MRIKKNAFAVFDCEKEGWTDVSALEPHVLRSGQQKHFAFYVYDRVAGKGFVAVSETPQETANSICIDHCLVPTDFVVLLMAINVEQTEMLDHELDDGDLENGIAQEITPVEFMKNMTRMFGGMIMTINSVRDGAPPDAIVTFSCDGQQCSADISGKPDISSFGECIDVSGVDKEAFIKHVDEYMSDEDTNGPICSSENQMFVKITDNKPDNDFSDRTTVDISHELVRLKFASHVEQENQAINNHQSLMALGVIMEGTLEKAISDGRISAHFVPDAKPKPSMGRVMGGTLNIDVAMRRQEVGLPPLFTPNYLIERFNMEFPSEEPLTEDELDFAMNYLGFRGYYDFYPDDPHIVTAATSQMQTVIFIKRAGKGKYSDCGIGFFITPIGINELVKAVVKMRFHRDSRHAVLEVTNDVQKKTEISALIDRYTDAYGDAVGDYLIEVVKYAMGKSEFGHFGLPEKNKVDGEEDDLDEEEIVELLNRENLETNEDDIGISGITTYPK